MRCILAAGLRVLALGLVVVLILVTVEFGMALLRPDSSAAPAGYAGSAADRSGLQADIDLLWRNRPLAQATRAVSPAPFRRNPVWTARINSDGFRGPERTHDREDGEPYRILCLGDSVTYGFNVGQDATYPARLERMLSKKHPGRRFEVINAGVPGWSWVQGAAFLLRDGLALRPDLIVAAHGTDEQLWPTDVTDSEQMWRLADPLVHRWTSLESIALRSRVYRAIQSWMAGPSAGVSVSPGCRQQLFEAGVCRRLSPGEIEATVYGLNDTARTAGVDLLLLNLDFLGTPAGDALRRAVKSDAVRFIDSAQRLKYERLRRQDRQARTLGLAPPRVPFFRPGAVAGSAAGEQGARMRLRVRKTVAGAELRVRGRAYPDTGFSVDEKLYDDGTHGDEAAGDGVFSGIVQTPPSVGTLRYRFFLDDEPEFRDAPATRATNGDRVLQFNRDGDAPVESFGVRYRMSDDLHPDAKGCAHVAEGVMRAIETIPSFRRFVEPPLGDAEAPSGR
jgi:lysophospholipase L1-like esterase